MALQSRLKRAWNVFIQGDKEESKQPQEPSVSMNSFSGRIPYIGPRGLWRSNLSNTVFNKIAIDVANTQFLHVTTSDDGQMQTRKQSALQNCLSLEANIDQSGVDFLIELVYTMLEDGVVAAVPVDTTDSINDTNSYDIDSIRVGHIISWYPSYVRVRLYDDRDGQFKEVTVPKSDVAIIQSPMYEIVNTPNNILDRLSNKMDLLDRAEKDNLNRKLNLIMQLPYSVRSEKRKEEAKKRIEELQEQLSNNEYGIAYADSTEKITQLNNPLTNQLADEVKYLTDQFYSALGLTENVFNNTANATEMQMYYSRAIDPITKRIAIEFTRKFITKTARTQGQQIVPYRDPFSLVPTEKLATMADVFSRNAILTPNEIRGAIGFGPSKDPNADKLSNKNIADVNQDTADASSSVAAPDE